MTILTNERKNAIHRIMLSDYLRDLLTVPEVRLTA